MIDVLSIFESAQLPLMLSADKTLLDIIKQGGLMMFPLGLCSLFAISVVIDRIIAFRSMNGVDNYSLRAKVIEYLTEGRPEDALLVTADTKGPVSAVLMSGIQSLLKHRLRGTNEEGTARAVEKAMDDYSQHAMAAVEKRFIVLSTIGNTAPLLGMTGTVLGMITSFDKLSGEAASEGAGAVASGISEALITTAAGLIVAMIAVVPLRWFQSQSNQILLEIDEAATEMIDYMATGTAVTSAHAAHAPMTSGVMPNADQMKELNTDVDPAEPSVASDPAVKKVRRKVVKKVRRKKEE